MSNKNHPKIKYFDLYGLRKEKGEFLESHDVKNTKWQELELKEPNFWFVPKDMKGEKIYGKFISVKDVFKEFSSGIKTRRDVFMVGQSKDEIIKRLDLFSNKIFTDEMITTALRVKDSADWKINRAREIVGKKNYEELIREYNYRIFSSNWVYYDPEIIERGDARYPIMKNFLFNKNLALITTRILSSETFQHVFLSEIIGDMCFISNKGKEANYVFPLYLYNTDIYAPKNKKVKSSYGNLMLFDKPKEKEPNIKAEIIKKLSESYKKKITPEEIFYYIYAVLYSNIYRKKYNEFLKIDFPRVPLSEDAKLFSKISKLGEELVGLHLLKSDKLENSRNIKFPIVGTNKVEKREYKDNRIYINDKQYFEGVSPEVWNYYIGGYQVLDKWLKDRKGKTLSPEEVNHYLKVITALDLTIELQRKIDKIYPKVEQIILKMNLNKT